MQQEPAGTRKEIPDRHFRWLESPGFSRGEDVSLGGTADDRVQQLLHARAEEYAAGEHLSRSAD